MLFVQALLYNISINNSLHTFVLSKDGQNDVLCIRQHNQFQWRKPSWILCVIRITYSSSSLIKQSIHLCDKRKSLFDVQIGEVVFFNLSFASLTAFSHTFSKMTLDSYSKKLSTYEALSRRSNAIQIIAILTVIPTCKENAHSERTITTVTGKLMDKLTHSLR